MGMYRITESNGKFIAIKLEADGRDLIDEFEEIEDLLTNGITEIVMIVQDLESLDEEVHLVERDYI